MAAPGRHRLHGHRQPIPTSSRRKGGAHRRPPSRTHAAVLRTISLVGTGCYAAGAGLYAALIAATT